MVTPDWKKFEELVASIQQDLAPEAKVTANAKLTGKSGTPRQIDILIEQETGQYSLRIVMDCKDYKVPVDVNDVEAFLGLVEDVGAHKAAMVAANGFTDTAKKRASSAGLDLFRLVDTANHKWRSYVSIPAVLRDYQIAFYTFSVSWTGYGSLDIRKDLRYMPILRSDGTLIDYAVNLVSARWEDETVPVVVGEHRDIPLTSEPTFLQGPDVFFEATIRLNATVREMIYFGYLPIVEMRGLASELKDVIHAAKGLTTAPVNPEKISREWQKIESIEQLAVKPVMKFSVKSPYPRYEPNPD